MPTYITIAESINANTCSYNRKIYIPPVYFYVAIVLTVPRETYIRAGMEWQKKGWGYADDICKSGFERKAERGGSWQPRGVGVRWGHA
jgi:hypothetical protein